MNTADGVNTFASTNGDGPLLLIRPVQLVEAMAEAGATLRIQVQITPEGDAANDAQAAQLATLLESVMQGEPREQWDLRPGTEIRRAGSWRWEWELLSDPELRPTVVALDRGLVTWMQVKPAVRQRILLFYAAHLVRGHGEKVSQRLWNELKPEWMPTGSRAQQSYDRPWVEMIDAANRLLAGTAAASGA